MLVAHLATVLAAGSSGSTHKSGSGGLSFLLLIAVFAALYFGVIRRQRTKQRAALDKRRQIEVGDEVVTTAALIARVVELDDDTATLEIAPGVHAKFLRQAIVRPVEQPEPDEAATDAAHADGAASGQTSDGDPATQPAGSS